MYILMLIEVILKKVLKKKLIQNSYNISYLFKNMIVKTQII